jgi:pimeloyl-ACP methyl ester carboxylesterase
MSATRVTRSRVAVVIATALTVPASLLTATPAQAAPAYDKTSPVEAQRVDRVPVPKFAWWDCSVFSPGAQCASANLPLDYDQPKGAKTSVAVLRLRAADQKHKIGTLFLNPGGPGGSGIGIAAAAPYFLGPDVLAKFDIVGFDPRGTNFSDNVRCWKNLGDQDKAVRGLRVNFPWTDAERAAFVTSSKAFGRACSTTGKPLSANMSTAEVARDMDVLRRAFGDKQLTYLGFSYGTYLGQVYSNLFPDRVRAVAIDGVIDPIGWAGTAATRNTPQTARIRSGEGAAKTLHEILVRCGKAGPSKCTFASTGDPSANYATIISRLKKAPLEITDPDGLTFTISYADLVGILLGAMYYPNGSATVSDALTSVYVLLEPSAKAGSSAAARQAQARKTQARKTLSGILAAEKARAASAKAARAKQIKASGFARYEFPYDNSFEAFQTVLCTDGLNPADASKWSAYADAAEKKAPDFGRAWTWASAPCASNTWTVRDKNAFTGPFTHRTVNPVLVVGNYWDPATNYDNAVRAASLLPNSRAISNDSWGHTAYGSSACIISAVDSYLLSKKLPAKGTTCVGDVQPFTTSLAGPTAQAASGNHRPPVLPAVPATPHQ